MKSIKKSVVGLVGVGTLLVGLLVAAPAQAVTTPQTAYSCTGIRGVTAFSSTTGWTAHTYVGLSQSGSGYSAAKSWATGGSRQSWSTMKSGKYDVTGTTIASYGATCYYI